jgi:hypothetical protein
VAVQVELAGLASIPFRTRKWAQAIATASVKTVPAGVAPLEWARVNAGKVDRESLGGDVLRPAGAAGTGDWTMRTLARIQRDAPALVSKVRVVQDGQATGPWAYPRDSDGKVVAGPYAIPGDGLGWGRGLAQIDWQSHEFARTGPWQDPHQNLAYGAALLASLYRTWVGGASAARWGAVRLALDSYNAGVGGVRAALSRGADPDSVTTGGNYATDVLRRAGLNAPAVA